MTAALQLEAALLRGLLDGVERVGEDGARIVEEPPDQGALAVVHAARGEEPQQAVAGWLGCGH